MKTVDAYWNTGQYELLKQLSEIRERLYDQEELVSVIQSMLTKGVSKEQKYRLQNALQREFSTTKTLLNESIAILSNGLDTLRKGVSSDDPFEKFLIRSEKDEILSDLYDNTGVNYQSKDSDTISSTPILQFESAPIPSLTVQDYVDSIEEEMRRDVEYGRIMNEEEERVDVDDDPFSISEKIDVLHKNQFYVDVWFSGSVAGDEFDDIVQIPPQMVERISFDAIGRCGTFKLRLLTFDGSGEISFSILKKLIDKRQNVHRIDLHVLDVSGVNKIGTILFSDVTIERASSEFDHADGQIVQVDVAFSF